MESSGNNLPNTQFHLHCFKMGSAGLLSSLVQCLSKMLTQENEMYFKAQVGRNGQLRSLCSGMVQ